MSTEFTKTVRGDSLLERLSIRSMVVLLTIEGSCSCLRAKVAHMVGHLPLTRNNNDSSEKAKRDPGYTVRPIEQTIAAMRAWLKNEMREFIVKYAVFTGATGGLGTLCVKTLSETEKWTVFAAGTNEAALEQLEKLPNIIPVRLDITKQESIDAALEIVKSSTATLDAIVNFAGLTCFTSLIEGDSVDAIERLLNVNVIGTARVNRTFFDMIYQGHGRIINCSSESGWMTPQPFAGPYVLSKYALEAYNDSLRRELMFLGIPVIKIQPGSYETHITQQVNDYFDKTLSETKYYKKLLVKMKPLMTMELNQKNDPHRLVKAVIKAMESEHPKLKYRIGTGKLLAMLELLPEKGVDAVYKLIFERQLE